MICNSLLAQSLQWAKGVGGSGLDQGRSLCNDAQGNVYCTGKFSNTVDFDPGAGIFNLTAVGSYDSYVLKLDAAGNFVWAKRFGGVAEDFSESIAIDNNGNIIVAGHYIGTADFDPGAASFNLTSNGSEDIFILKLDPSGNFIWAKSIGAANSDQINSIAADPSGNIYTVGQFTFTVDFDPGPGTFNLNWTNGNYYVLKLDASGNFVWAYGLNATINDIHVDNAGNYYYTGNFGGTVDFDPSAAVYNLSTNFSAMFVVKFNAAGTLVLANRMECNGIIESRSICTDQAGNILTCGNFEGTANFSPNAAPYIIASNGDRDVFIHKLDLTGIVAWVNTIGSTQREYAFGIDTDVNDNVYIAGAFQGTVDFNPLGGVYSITALALVDAYTLKLNPTGSFAWAIPFQGFDQTYNYSIAANDDGSAYVTGDFSAATDFDPAAGFQLISPAGGADAYICKLGTCATLPSTGNISGNNALCAGSLATYSITPVAGATSYNWSVPSGYTINSGQNTTSITVYIGSNGGNITVTPSNSCSNGSIASLPISVIPLPTPSSISANGNTTFCVGGAVTLSGNTGGTWNTGATSASITVNNSGTYYVTNTNSCGTVNSNQINVTVLQAPVASSISANGNTTFCAGGSVTLSGNVGGIWSNGAGTSSITVNTSGNYFVTNSNACGSVNSNQINVTVNPLPIASSINANGNTTFCAGGSVLLSGNSGGTWNTGATTPTITVSNAGIYYVSNSNNCGTVYSNQINVTVLQAPDPSSISANGNTTFCAGGSVTLSGNVGGIWSNGASTSSITVNSSGNYFVTNSNACGSVNSNQINVTVNPLPIASSINANGNTTFCAGASVILSGNNNGIWSNGESTPAITVNTAGDYYVTNSNSCGSINSNHIIVTVNPLPTASSISAGGVTTFCNGNFVVLFGNTAGTWSTGSTAASITVTTGGDYYVTNTNSCGNATSNHIIVTVENAPVPAVIQASSATQFCNGDSVTLYGNTNGIWNTGLDSIAINVNTSGDYYVTTINSCGSITSNHIIVDVWPAPATPIITQAGNSLQATSGFATYQWYLNNTIIPGETQATISPINNGDYTVDAIDTNGCMATSQAFNFVIQGIGAIANNQIRVYPNPGNGILNIESSNITELTKIEILDAKGEIVFSEMAKGNFNKINLQNLAKGVYVLKVSSNITLSISKIILN